MHPAEKLVDEIPAAAVVSMHPQIAANIVGISTAPFILKKKKRF